MVLTLVMKEGLDSLDKVSELLERVKGDVVQHLTDAVERGETELVGVLCPETRAHEAPDDEREIVLDPGGVVVRQALQSIYADQFDLPLTQTVNIYNTRITENLQIVNF